MCCKDIVAFDSGNIGLTDYAIQMNYIRYCRLRDEESVKLKKTFYAVLTHGWVNHVDGQGNGGWDGNKLVASISQYYWSSGKHRAILMLSCFTGYGIAKQVAVNFHVPVVAPLAAAAINDVGQILVDDIGEKKRNPEGQGYNLPDNCRWIFYSPLGEPKEVSPFPVLQKATACELAGKYMSYRRR